jgi:predicted ATPase/DNA-binding CsgD family transcriptional regulator
MHLARSGPTASIDSGTWLRYAADEMTAARPAHHSLERTSLFHVSPFTGRAREVADLEARLRQDEVRLLTLTGPGGVGKTRLALHVASAVQDAYADGVCFVPLAPLADPALVFFTIAHGLGVREDGGRPLLTVVQEFLRTKHLLLVLDNFEHVLAAAPLVVDLLAAAPGLSVLVTSREPLHLYGEQEFSIPPLALPDPQLLQHSQHSLAVEQVQEIEAVQLFVARAQAVRRDFRLTPENAPAVVEICRRVDGLPLAIELAAARVKVLPPPALLARLTQPLALLTGGPRNVPARQQTLRNTIAWSYALLSPDEQALFRRLGVFAGGCTLDAAEAVCGAGTVEVLDGLGSLVDKSLLRQEEGPDGEPRFMLLETVREFALEQLQAAGEEVVLRDRHLAWCVALAHAADEAQRSRGVDRFHEAQRKYFAEWDNVRAALAWGATTPDGASRALDILARVILTPRPSQDETVRWLETLLDVAPVRTKVRARALLRLDHLRRLHHDFAGARAAVEEACAIAGELGDEELATHAAARRALVDANLGEYARAVAELERCLTLARERGNWTWVEQFARDLGGIALAMGDFSRARAALAESRDAGQAHASRFTTRPRLFLTILDRLTGDLQGARTALEALCAEMGAWNPEASKLDRFHFHEPARWALASIARDQGGFDEARRLLVHSLEDLRQHGEVGQLSAPASMLGLLDIAAGHAERGVTIVAAFAPPTGPIGTVHVPELRLEAPIFLERARATLGAAGYDAAWARGRLLTPQEAIELALAGNVPHPASPPARQTAPGVLSPRETQVAALVARGLTNREIATALVITEHTAMRHLEHILSKLGLRSRTQVAAWAVAHGVAGSALDS